MAVKIRCRGCEEVLNLPDRARGKAVRCPHCETRIKVPAGKTAPAEKPPRRRAAATAGDEFGGDDDFLADLDLSRLEDRHARVCPKCGADVPDEEFECPRCGIDIRTGRLSDRRRRKLERKGPDPAEFTGNAPGDAWRFLKDNRRLAVRTVVLLLGSVALAGTFGYLWAYFYQIPLKIFFGLLTVVAFFAGPGWVWHLYLEILEGALAKKRKLKRVGFDFFLNVSLGLKAVTWFLFFALPLQLIPAGVGLVLYMNGNQAVGLALVGAGFLPVLALVPVAMPHMVMPVTASGWLSPKVLGTFFRIAARPALFWLLFFLLTNLPAFALVGVAGAVGGRDMAAFFDDVSYNATVKYAKAYEYAKNEEPIPAIEQWKNREPRALDAARLALPGGLLAGACIAFGLAAPYWMRMNGLMLHFYKDHLDLEKLAREGRWTPKTGDEMEQALGTFSPVPLQIGLFGSMASVAILIVAVGCFMLSEVAPDTVVGILPHLPLMTVVGLVLAVAGRCLSMTVPEQSGARELVMGSLILDGFALLLAGGMWLELEPIMNLVAAVTGFLLQLFQPFLLFLLVSVIMFGGTVVFMKAATYMASFTRRQDIASWGGLAFTIMMWLLAALFVLDMIPITWILAFPGFFLHAFRILMYVLGGGFLVGLLAYAYLLWQVSVVWRDPKKALMGSAE